MSKWATAGWPNGAGSAEPRFAYSVRLAAFYGALFLIYGVHLPYLPVWLKARGLTAEEIAAITAAPYFLRAFITPATAMLADRLGAHRAIVNGLAWLVLLLAVLLMGTESFWPILATAVPFAIALSTIVPLTETIAVAGVRAHGLDYGRMRLWGSITFVAAGFVGGWLIDRTGPGAVLGCIVASAVATAVSAWFLPECAPPPSTDAARSVAPAAPNAAPPKPAPGESGVTQALALVRSPLFLAFLVAAGAAQGAHGMFYAFGAIAWHAQGITTAWVGVLWAIAIVGEVILFAYSGRVVRRWGPPVLLVAATSASVLRWLAMSLAPPLALLIPLQTLHTLTYGASHLGAMHFISLAVPVGAQGTAQALYATVASGVLMGVATLVSGWFFARFGSHAYIAMALLSAAGLAGALYVRARWDGALLWKAGPAS